MCLKLLHLEIDVLRLILMNPAFSAASLCILVSKSRAGLRGKHKENDSKWRETRRSPGVLCEDAVREKSLISPSDSLLGDCLEKEGASPAYLPSREFAPSYPNGRRPSIKSEQSSK